MPKTKILQKKHRDPIGVILRRILKNKVFVISVVMIVLGLVLVRISYDYSNVYVTKNVNTYNTTVNGNRVSSVIVTQPYNLTEKITFNILSQTSVHYKLYKYEHLQFELTDITQYTFIKQGNVSNDSTFSFSPTPQLQGQQYAINLTTNTNSSVQVELVAVNSMTLTKHSSKDLGGIGIGLTLSGVVLLALAISRNIGSEETEVKRQ